MISFYCRRLLVNGRYGSFFLSGLKKPPGTEAASEQVKEEEESHGSDEEASEQQSQKPAVKVHLTPLEVEGMWNLLGKLEALPSNKKCVPAGIHNAPALITHIKVWLVCLYFVFLILNAVQLTVFAVPLFSHTTRVSSAGFTKGAHQWQSQTVLHRKTHRQMAKESKHLHFETRSTLVMMIMVCPGKSDTAGLAQEVLDLDDWKTLQNNCWVMVRWKK